MTRSWTPLAGAVLLAVSCAPAPAPAAQGEAAQAAAQSVQCTPVARMPVEGRASPYDSTLVPLGGAQAKVCYGRPSAKGRTIFGGLAPYGKLWRTGANEPTIIHLPFAARVAGMSVQPGSYSLYTIPGQEEWTVILNRSTGQWGHESQYNAQVQAQEVGRVPVRGERTDAPVETFTIRAAPRGARAADLVLEWENTRVRIPVERS
jgi:hypothetical protein